MEWVLALRRAFPNRFFATGDFVHGSPEGQRWFSMMYIEQVWGICENYHGLNNFHPNPCSCSVQVTQYFTDMVSMVLQGVQVYQDVIQITYHAYVHQISKYLIDEPLEGCWCIGESEWHYSPFV